MIDTNDNNGVVRVCGHQGSPRMYRSGRRCVVCTEWIESGLPLKINVRFNEDIWTSTTGLLVDQRIGTSIDPFSLEAGSSPPDDISSLVSSTLALTTSPSSSASFPSSSSSSCFFDKSATGPIRSQRQTRLIREVTRLCDDIRRVRCGMERTLYEIWAPFCLHIPVRDEVYRSFWKRQGAGKIVRSKIQHWSLLQENLVLVENNLQRLTRKMTKYAMLGQTLDRTETGLIPRAQGAVRSGFAMLEKWVCRGYSKDYEDEALPLSESEQQRLQIVTGSIGCRHDMKELAVELQTSSTELQDCIEQAKRSIP